MREHVQGKIRSSEADLAVEESEGKFIIRGWANRPVVNRYLEMIDHPSAFAELLPRFLANPVMLYAHSGVMPVGVWTTIDPRPEGLWVEGEIRATDAIAEDLKDKIRQRIVKALSIGFRPMDEGRGEDGVWHVRKLDLYEISIVAIPADFTALFDFEERSVSVEGEEHRQERSIRLLSPVTPDPDLERLTAPKTASLTGLMNDVHQHYGGTSSTGPIIGQLGQVKDERVDQLLARLDAAETRIKELAESMTLTQDVVGKMKTVITGMARLEADRALKSPALD